MRLKLSGIKERLFFFLLVCIVTIGCVDIYWAVKNKDVLYEAELNPLGKLLIGWGGVELFVSLKMFGTFCFYEIAKFLYLQNEKMAWTSIVIIFIMHLFLLNILMGGYN